MEAKPKRRPGRPPGSGAGGKNIPPVAIQGYDRITPAKAKAELLRSINTAYRVLGSAATGGITLSPDQIQAIKIILAEAKEIIKLDEEDTTGGPL